MLPGINEDIVRGSRTYHLQTEDRGERNPEVVSVLFLGGAVLTTERTSYEAILEHPERVRGVKKLMIKQHRDVLRRILEGEFDEFEVARRAMTEAEPLVFEAESVPDLETQAAEAVASVQGAGEEETVVPGSPTAEDLVAARETAVALVAADDEPALQATAEAAAEETIDVIPELVDAWGEDEEWPATGFGAEVITERPFALVVALALKAIDDAKGRGGGVGR